MWAAGTVIAGKYELLDPIGEGGMGAVWRARHQVLGRQLAIKFIRAEIDREQVVPRFLREAQIAASIRHRNVVDVVDFGTLGDGMPYIVMELLVGLGFGEWLTGTPRPDEKQILDVLVSALGGLAAVHDAGVVHRDLKPDNIFLSRDADGILPKLVDFGIARPSSPITAAAGTLTRSGTIVGTPAYMSPEQVRGVRDLDARTDVYGMGVILFEALSGRLPFDQVSLGDLIIAIGTKDAPDIRSVRQSISPEVAAVVHRAMARDRAERFPDAREMRQALVGAARAQGMSIPSSEITGPTVVPRDEAAPHRPITTSSVSTPLVTEINVLPADRSMRRWALAGLLVLAIGGSSAAVVFTRPEPTAIVEAPASPLETAPVEHPPAPQPPSPPAPQALPAGLPPPAAPAQVTVRLSGLPDGATLRVDGEPATGPLVTLQRDGREHVLEAEKVGAGTWRQTHVASEDGAYTVELHPARDPRRPPPGKRRRSGSGMIEPDF